jgi:NTP pyrophosphatase (non-canonical NTP hydrolase)
MRLSEMQALALARHQERGYTNDLPTLGLGLCEEAGEIAKAINLLNPLYKPTPGRHADSLEHEICDLLVYLFAIANSAGIDIESEMCKKLQPSPDAWGFTAQELASGRIAETGA